MKTRHQCAACSLNMENTNRKLSFCLISVLSMLVNTAKTNLTNGDQRVAQDCPRFDYEYKLIERLVILEIQLRDKTTEVQEISQQLQHLDSIIQSQKNALGNLKAEILQKDSSVAFMAQLSSGIRLSSPAPNHVIVFDLILTNQGSAYNSNYGVFTAPVQGTFQFHVTASSSPKARHEELRIDILKNMIPVGYIFLDHNDKYSVQRSTTVVLQLDRRDTVCAKITHVKGNVVLLGCCFYTHFSGSLIHQN